MDTPKIEITNPFFPPKKELLKYIDQIYKNQWLTNNGPLVKKLEKKLINYLGLKRLALVSSGTMALQIVLEMLPGKGEVITTPFSFVATSSAIEWQGHTPVYADINPGTFNIDPETIIPLINKNTKAILATHVFGNPCEIEKLESISKKYNLTLIFDAAHSFGVKYKGKSILTYGDYSCISFHATKLFHTIEGGAIVCKKQNNDREVLLRRNFGFSGPYTFNAIGINGKMSEIHAAFGLANLKYIDNILLKYQEIYNEYLSYMNKKIILQKINKKASYNFAYMPILFKTEDDLLESILKLNENDIFPRRYFYPSLNLGSSKNVRCINSEMIANKILCLPLYFNLKKTDVLRINNIL